MENNLFNSAGYILAKDYVDDIRQMQKNGPWRLPLGVGDRFHLSLLSLFLKFSWFKDIYIKYPHDHSPAYDIILNFLKKEKILSTTIKFSEVFFRSINVYSLRLLDGDKIIVKGTGHHENNDKALSMAIGELIERSATGIYDENDTLVFGSFEELKEKYGNIFYPPIYHRFLPQQKELFEELKVDDNQKMEWVKGFNFLDNEVALIPRSITSWRYRGGKIVMNPTTNGSAGGFNKDEVIKNAILEYVERDSFLVHWLTQIPPKIIANESLPNDLFVYIRLLNDMGIEVYVLDTTTNIEIPSACVVIQINNSNKKAVAVSGGAGCSFYTAIKKALEEAQQCAGNLFIYDDKTKAEELTPFVSGVNKDKRVAMWQGDEWVERFKWFISGEIIGYKDRGLVGGDKNEINFLRDVFSKLGDEYTPLIYFPKNKAMSKLGFCVVQSFIPFCFPLFLLEKYGTFDSDRLKQFAKYKGVDNFKLNPYPHPFP